MPECDASSSSSSEFPPLPVLSKDDCRLFNRQGFPTAESPGSVLGVLWWAADFDFVFDLDRDVLRILSAFD